MIPPPPRSTLFPYTTLFRSVFELPPVQGVDERQHQERRLRLPAALTRPALAVLPRSEEHTSELQSRLHLVCRLLLEKKKKNEIIIIIQISINFDNKLYYTII